MGKNELKHFGVLGMRWGVRRGRNAVSSKARKHPRAKDLSDDELKQRITRLEREQNYKRLTSGKMDKAKKIVGSILLGYATAKASKFIGLGLDKGISSIGKAAANLYMKSFMKSFNKG